MDVIEQDPQTEYARDPELAETIREASRTALETIVPGLGICKPFPIDLEVVRRCFYVDLCAWGIFNPLGPTIAGVGALLTPAGDWLLFSGFRHPRVSQAEVRGLVPDSTLDRSSRLYRTLYPIFSTNGGPEIPLLLALPTHVRTLPDPLLTMPHLRELLWAATPHLDETDLGRSCDYLERFPDPLERTFTEMDEALKRWKSGKPTRTARPIGRSTFRRWWDLASDPAHAAREMGLLDFAWKKSIEIAPGGMDRA